MKKKVMALLFDDITVEEAAAAAITAIERGERCRVVTPNAEIAYDAEKNEHLRDIINSSELVLPDGIGVIKASGIVGDKLGARAPGVEFGMALCRALAEKGYGLFLYGGKPGVAEKAAENLAADYPGLRIAGTLNGYGDREEAAKKINASGAQALFVCLGCPKQEEFMAGHELRPHVMAGLGGSLDVFSGVSERAPEFYRKNGLEWLYRLLKQPSRIKRMAKLPAYLLLALKYRFRRTK